MRERVLSCHGTTGNRESIFLSEACRNWESTFFSRVYRKQGQYLLVTGLQETGTVSSFQAPVHRNCEIIFLSRAYRKQEEYLLVTVLQETRKESSCHGLEKTGRVSSCHGSTGYKIQGEYHLVRGLQEKGKMLFFSWGSMLFSGENLPRVFSKGERTCFFRSLQEPPGTGKLPSLIGVKCTFRLKLTLARLYVMLRGVLWELCLM